MILLGLGGAGILAFSGWVDVRLLDESKLCLVMDDSFSSGVLDEGDWVRDVEMPWSISLSGGGGKTTRRGGFEMTTGDEENLFISNGRLHFHPTVTPDPLLIQTFTLPQCTSAIREGRRNNTERCTTSSNPALGLSLPPIRSARIHSAKTIRYGRVSINAQLPRGDWLVPSFQLVPSSSSSSSSSYDPDQGYPLSGVLDLLQARGNDASYPTQGINHVTSSVSFGLGDEERRISGWFGQKRMDYSRGTHEYTLEWTEQFIRVFVDGRLKTMLDLNVGPSGLFSGFHKGGKGKGKGKKTLWDQASFPQTTLNETTGQVAPLNNPYLSSIAPFDKPFHLSMHLGVGGTDGWFPDGQGGKVWYDAEGRVEQTRGAMLQFARALEDGRVRWDESKMDMKM